MDLLMATVRSGGRRARAAERVGRPLAEDRGVHRCEPAQLEEPEICGDAGDGGLAGARGLERVPHGLHAAPREIALRARAADGMTGVSQTALAHACDIAQLCHVDGLVEMRVQELVEPMD